MILLLKDRIKDIRTKQGMDQETFGRQFNPSVSGSAVSRWEKGDTKPNKQRMKRIAELGHTSINYLLYGYDFNPHEFINEIFDNYILPYYFSMETVKWGDEEYSIHDSVKEYFNSKKIELPEWKFYDEKKDNIIDEYTPGVKAYMMANLKPLVSTKYVDELIRNGNFVVNNLSGINHFGIDDSEAIGVACNALLDETIKLQNIKSPLQREFSKMAEPLIINVEVALQNKNFSKAHENIESLIKKMKEFNDRF